MPSAQAVWQVGTKLGEQLERVVVAGWAATLRRGQMRQLATIEPVVVAVLRDLDAVRVGDLQDHLTRREVALAAVDGDGRHKREHGSERRSGGQGRAVSGRGRGQSPDGFTLASSGHALGPSLSLEMPVFWRLRVGPTVDRL